MTPMRTLPLPAIPALLCLAFSASAQTPVSFTDDVHPILVERCFKCHTGDEKKGGLSMSTRASLLEGGEFGVVVVPGKADESVLIELVTSEDPEERMPNKGDPLSPEQIDILRRWINEGLVWDLEAGPPEGYTAPVAPREVQLPRGRGIHRSNDPIDKLIATYFEEREVAVPELVDDRTFIRRAYLDLIGLLPTEAELAAFLADSSKDKREKLVDDLLADRRSYAEHWMTFWNDCLRNDFQGTGYIDGGREQITHWLYGALRDNTPYDEFARELIDPARGAEGFVKGITWRGAATANQTPPLQAARSVAQVFLGVNLKCASCHDSFVNSWKLADSYGLANAFSEEPLELVRCDVPTGKMAETRFLWPEIGAIDGAAPIEQRRTRVAELVTAPENGRFARVFVNRAWAALLGRGLVEPMEDIESEPWSADVLDWLAADFAANGYDVRALLARIAKSKTYQLASDHAERADGEAYAFRGPRVKRMTAEQFYDAMSCVTGQWQADPKFEPPPDDGSRSAGTVRAWRANADPLMRALGRPSREQVTMRRPAEYSRLQALELTNGDTLAMYVAAAAAQVGSTVSRDRLDVLFLRALQREPSSAERAAFEASGLSLERAEDVEDALWAVFMAPEFQLIY